jgi:hypothetical protein
MLVAASLINLRAKIMKKIVEKEKKRFFRNENFFSLVSRNQEMTKSFWLLWFYLSNLDISLKKHFNLFKID